MSKAFFDYFRCPSRFSAFEVSGELSAEEGYFSFGGAVCYGYSSGPVAPEVTPNLHDAWGNESTSGGSVCLPFDLTNVVNNLREERYPQTTRSLMTKVSSGDGPRDVYYFLRPILPVVLRKHLQRIRLSGWKKIAFPRWPVDLSVDTLMWRAMELALRGSGAARIPFIWFWPDGAPGSLIVTHDVESAAGNAFCDCLMDIDDAAGIRSAFQVVPEARYELAKDLSERLRRRGFEVNVHDLNHDGQLFQNFEVFFERAAQINRYALEFGSRGFRSGGMYREQHWFDVLDVSFDMSVPNVAHLEPQRGGCCTVMPYFTGKILELPLTTVQDYSLFHILGEYSIDLWKKQIELILSRHGMISILTHPDYLIDRSARRVYERLLQYLVRLRDDHRIWVALPNDVDNWWRQRSQMTLTGAGDSWRIEGPGSERARVAYATLTDEGMVVTLDARPVKAPRLEAAG